MGDSTKIHQTVIPACSDTYTDMHPFSPPCTTTTPHHPPHDHHLYWMVGFFSFCLIAWYWIFLRSVSQPAVYLLYVCNSFLFLFLWFTCSALFSSLNIGFDLDFCLLLFFSSCCSCSLICLNLCFLSFVLSVLNTIELKICGGFCLKFAWKSVCVKIS